MNTSNDCSQVQVLADTFVDLEGASVRLDRSADHVEGRVAGVLQPSLRINHWRVRLTDATFFEGDNSTMKARRTEIALDSVLSHEQMPSEIPRKAWNQMD